MLFRKLKNCDDDDDDDNEFRPLHDAVLTSPRKRCSQRLILFCRKQA